MHYHNLLAAQRKANALTHEDIAALVGRTPPTIARYEAGLRVPALSTALRFEFLFGQTISALFPELVVAVVQETIPAIQRLSIAIEGYADAAAERQRAFISTLANRIERILPDA